jgi:hypothetical protein
MEGFAVNPTTFINSVKPIYSWDATVGAGTVLVADDEMALVLDTQNTARANRAFVRVWYGAVVLTELERLQLRIAAIG